MLEEASEAETVGTRPSGATGGAVLVAAAERDESVPDRRRGHRRRLAVDGAEAADRTRGRVPLFGGGGSTTQVGVEASRICTSRSPVTCPSTDSVTASSRAVVY